MTGESISSIGNLGLGNFGSYFDPSSYAMMSGYGGYGNYGGYGSYGMTNPMLGYSSAMMMNNPMMTGMYGGAFMQNQMEALKQYYKFQEDLEQQRLEHQTEMHRKQQLSEVANLNAHEQKFLYEVMSDGFVKKGIRDIYDGIRQGHMDDVVAKFYTLKQEILNKHSDYFNTKEGSVNLANNLNEYISVMYSEIGANFQGGIKPDLRQDIRSFGESPFQHGWNKHWLKNRGHNKLNAEQALNQIFDTGVNDVGSKKLAENVGAGLSMATTGAIGGAAVATIPVAMAKAFVPSKIGFLKCMKGVKWFALAGAAINTLGALAWQYSKT